VLDQHGSLRSSAVQELQRPLVAMMRKWMAANRVGESVKMEIDRRLGCFKGDFSDQLCQFLKVKSVEEALQKLF